MLSPDRIYHLDGETSKGIKEMSPFLELEQFTGLRDKNGKEIYEGDILYPCVIDGIICKSEVIFSPGAYCKIIIGEKKEGIEQLLCEHIKFSEIIGNIHENPELLK